MLCHLHACACDGLVSCLHVTDCLVFKRFWWSGALLRQPFVARFATKHCFSLEICVLWDPKWNFFLPAAGRKGAVARSRWRCTLFLDSAWSWLLSFFSALPIWGPCERWASYQALAHPPPLQPRPEYSGLHLASSSACLSSFSINLPSQFL